MTDANAPLPKLSMRLAAGMDDYVTKPIRVAAPVEALDRASHRTVVST